MQPSVTLRSRGINWGSAQIRCANGCPTRKAGFSFPPDGERAARAELEKRWEKLVAGESDDCDEPEVMIAGNPDIQQAEKLLAAAAGNWAAVTAAAAESWHEVIDCQDAADEAVAEEVSNWDA
ncbi:hypothetical protein [Enterobacter asburiae]|uniref:hypothetical protein n=1 Tax=Enterobacter asburiae TaxID=61645 RepID=UPI001576FE12|nr:hypothetical protein [Enterobacter asburiae]NQF31010.1 hypothetical protein [Enterobacter asburiae]